MGRKSLADQRRTEIIKAFHLCVIQEGLGNASIRKVAATAGVKPSVLHHYFSSREEIIEEAVIYFTDQLFEAFQAQMAASGLDPFNQGMAFIFSSGMISDSHTGFFLECCVAARHNPRVRRTLASLFERFRKAIVDQLQILPGFDTLTEDRQALLAATLVAIHEGIELQYFADPRAVNLNQALEITGELIRLFIDQETKKGG